MFCCCDPIVFPCPPHIQCNTCLLHCKCILTHSLSDLLIRAFTLARFDERQYKYTVVHGTTALFKSLSSAAPFSSSPCVTSHVSRFSRVTLVAGQHKKRKEKKRRRRSRQVGYLHPPPIPAEMIPDEPPISHHQPLKQIQKHHCVHHLVGGSSNVSDDRDEKSESSSNR